MSIDKLKPKKKVYFPIKTKFLNKIVNYYNLTLRKMPVKFHLFVLEVK